MKRSVRIVATSVAAGAAGLTLATALAGSSSGDNSTHLNPAGARGSCSELLGAGWRGPKSIEGFNLNWDPSTGAAEVEFTDGTYVAIEDMRSAKCASLPGIGNALRRATMDHENRRADECASSVNQIIEGVAPQHGDIVGDLDALRAHVASYCPPGFLTQLEAAGK
ncbi:hypothetical protein [Nocardioides daeguensis]|uniref:DUF732 domain-containing protein n=1 Tax=Nocardioides daeguensis TaxID=908359 RepID=A0ABP6W9H9_9ACTN|nr:hypothetical protein [Nocardioides daeguensis]MBV6729821.1 hypothetical protein [Nocardioides daeguensis]MCR1774351.1 hypothetical protein [Nocardioides daeguensis]